MNGRLRNLMEALVTGAIVLVLIQTLAEDILVCSGAAWNPRRMFIVTGFAFDLFFTLEFFLRSWNALRRRELGRYLFFENGWVDFVASVPLLILTSGPVFLTSLEGAVFAGSGSLLGLLKVVKAVRMARVLRLLRLLKIFRRIRFADSQMVQRHTVRIITTAAATLIFTATLIGALFAFSGAVGSDEAWLAEQEAAVSSLAGRPDLAAGPDTAAQWGASRPSVILLKNRDWTLFARYSDDEMVRLFGPSDYAFRNVGDYSVWFDLRPVAVAQSRLNLLIFISTLLVVLVLMVSYSPHFALTVSDPVNVMLRGLTEKSYNLEVRVPPRLARDEMFRLAAAYNGEYLPLKERTGLEEGSGGTLDITLEDIRDILIP